MEKFSDIFKKSEKDAEKTTYEEESFNAEDVQSEEEKLSETEQPQEQETVVTESEQSEEDEVVESAESTEEEQSEETEMHNVDFTEQPAVDIEAVNQQIETLNKMMISNNEMSKNLFDQILSLKQQIESLNNTVAENNTNIFKLNKAIELHKSIESDMNRELNRYKDDYYASTLKPILSDICLLHSYAIEKAASESESEKTQKTFGVYCGLLEKTFKRYQIEVISAEPGDEFDGDIHHIVGVIETEDTSLEHKIAEVKGKTYRYNYGCGNLKTVLKPAMVKVYKIVKKQTEI